MATTTDRHVDAVCTALVRNAEQLASVLRQISDPTPKAIGLWSIGETANHVAGSHEYFMAAALGEATLESLDEVDSGNARSLADDPERDPSVLADRLETGVKELVSYAGTVDGNPAVEPFIGVEVPLSTLLAIELGEVLVHGYDIARAAGLPVDDRAIGRFGGAQRVPGALSVPARQEALSGCSGEGRSTDQGDGVRCRERS